MVAIPTSVTLSDNGPRSVTPVAAIGMGALGPADSVSVVPSTDQDPIFDHSAGAKATVTTSASTIITMGAGHKYLRISSDADVFIKTDGTTPSDNGQAILIKANVTEMIPVAPLAVIKGVTATGTAIVRVVPMKTR